MDRILVATDLSARSDRALARGIALARSTGAELNVVSVVDDDLPAELILAHEEKAEEVLKARLEKEGVEARLHVENGHPVQMVPGLARAIGADLLVVGGHRGRGWEDWISEPNLTRILRAIECDALVALQPPEVEWTRIVLGWDGSPVCRAAIGLARALAPEAELIPARAVAPPSAAAMGAAIAVVEENRIATDEAEESLRAVSETLEGPVGKPQVRVGGPAWVLDRVAQDVGATAIAVGRHARGGLARLLLGHTALALAMSTQRDLLIAAPPSG
ncbi:universal stress protein [Jannaschia aquimarina]|uniref:Universal stress protein UspE n=1 Tax=Jannaschia aquimarina TaxID=935700 RepID=A0A0D1EGS7_9RHOB|nr:universal stress protein [Jannaschia aquimarina]KIT16116.1 universal stress protein UspE [Jannaschia aquimarina]SNT37484.1 Nucleotide-binding universal stress protein, UspA family [Jannaschia aquimarina]